MIECGRARIERVLHARDYFVDLGHPFQLTCITPHLGTFFSWLAVSIFWPCRLGGRILWFGGAPFSRMRSGKVTIFCPLADRTRHPPAIPLLPHWLPNPPSDLSHHSTH